MSYIVTLIIILSIIVKRYVGFFSLFKSNKLYDFDMNEKKLKLLLREKKYYPVKSEMPRLIAKGERRPPCKVICELDKLGVIPYDVWDDIKGYFEKLEKDDESNNNE